MPTTTNFGWTTPADTDLVKDGAAAIRTFAGNVDTSLVDLKGGTTGQYLQKNSGTDLDYVWADVSAGGMTLISTTTLSGASITLSSIPATYNSLYIVIRNFVPATDSSNLNMRLNGDSATRYLTFASISTTAARTFDLTQVRVTTAADNAVSQSLSVIQIPDYTNTTTFKMLQTMQFANDFTTTTSVRGYWDYSVYNQTPAISSITFLCDSGNLTSGTVLLYGVK